jgi:hypothetical protein
MQKKKYNLAEDIVKVGPEKVEASKPVQESKKEEEYILVTLRVKREFRQEFKAWCAKKNLSMSEAVQKAFVLLKDKHGY